MEYHTTESQEPRGVEEAGCKIYSGAPTVSQTCLLALHASNLLVYLRDGSALTSSRAATSR